MRIVVLGGGTVGTWIADLLCRHRHSVTVVDNNPSNCRLINNELDVRVVTGSASQSSVLFQSDVIGADLCLAVTGDDEVNIVAASMAKAMGARRSIARIYGPVFHDVSTFDYQRHFGIDRLLSLEHLTAMELARGIRNPGSVVLEHFARGELEVLEVVMEEPTKAIGVSLKDLGLPKTIRIGSIYRDGRMWIAAAEDVIELNDRITIIGNRQDVDEVKGTLQKKQSRRNTVVIAGGGETGYHLARSLQGERFSVVLMEQAVERSEFLAKHLVRSTVVQADATRRSILEEERVGSADYFIACTGDDENNIMAGVEARDIGAKNVMAVVGRPDYANVVGKLGIDLAVSPRDVLALQILGFLNTGPVISRSTLLGGGVGVYEIEVLPGAQATEHVLANLHLPERCLIAAVMREDYVKVAGADDRLQAGDVVVALIEDSDFETTLQQFCVNGR
ncbi:MAG: Trk system potassium transporter TrkA [Pirellulaceae bacterium]|jgi:trk system potassium uptake protein TrkA|nr:Trk system potassium transporter TrkA [Pirellulaceae bacterium]MDP6555022.1 Trk system potassium transporter TrkA [Pirellulaceae bacterium]